MLWGWSIKIYKKLQFGNEVIGEDFIGSYPIICLKVIYNWSIINILISLYLFRVFVCDVMVWSLCNGYRESMKINRLWVNE